jgi:hypothetical protein
MASAASASPSWVILGSEPRVTAADADLPPGADLSLALPAPPRVAILTIPPRIFPGSTDGDYSPSVLAVDASGLILLDAEQPPPQAPPSSTTPTANSPAGSQPARLTSSSTPNPPPPSRSPTPRKNIVHPNHLGLVASPTQDGHYMVVELQMLSDDGTADLLCFSSKVEEWAYKSVRYPHPSRVLSSNGVLSHAGRLWWVDLSWCLLTCDPFADAPVLSLVPLPEGKALKHLEAVLLDKYRCVGVSGGKLRFVDMYGNISTSGAQRISVWTLADPDSTEWTLEYEATLGRSGTT